MARETGNVEQQIGVETTPGTAVAATVRLATTSFHLGDKLATKQYRRRGAKSNTSSTIHKEWSEGTFDGPLSYSELCYILAGLFPYTVEAVDGVAGAYEWLFTPVQKGNDSFETYTIEEGDDEGAEQYENVTIASLDVNLDLEDANMNGNIFAQPGDPSFPALTADLAQLVERPVGSREIDLFINNSFATIGTTKITDPFDARLSIGEKRQQKWVLNSSYQSWKEQKEVIPEASLRFSAENNTQIRALLTALKQNPLQFLMAQAKGPLISGSTYYLIQMMMQGKIKSKDKQEDKDGIYAYDFEFGSVQEDADMGPAYSFRIINKLAAL